MKGVRIALILFLVLFVMPAAFALVSVSEMGYHPSGQKTVTVYTSAASGTYSLVSTATNQVVKSGTLSRPKDYSGNPVNCQGNNPCLVADFSEFTSPGTYYITTSLGENSRTFPINQLIYRNNAPLFNEFFDALSQRGSSYHADMNGFADPQFTKMADGSFILNAEQASLALMRLGDAYRRNPVLLASDKRTFVKSGTPDVVEHMIIYADYLAALQDAKIQERTDGVGFRLNSGMRIDNAFVPGPTGMTSLNVYDSGKNYITTVPVVSLCAGKTGAEYTACINKAASVYKCQADEPCLQLSYIDRTGTRVAGQTDGMGVDTGWYYEWSCFFDTNLAGGNFNSNTNPCMIYDTGESRPNTAMALFAYTAAIPAINQFDAAKANALLTRAVQTQQYIKSTYPISSAGQDAAYYGAANFLLFDLTGESKYLDEAYSMRNMVVQQLNSGGTNGNEFYWQEYIRHKNALTGAGKTYLVGTTDPVEFFRGKMWGDFKDQGMRSISANGEWIYQYDNNIQFMNSRYQLTEGVIAAKTGEFDNTPIFPKIADAQLAWLTGNNGVDTDPGLGANIQSISFIFGVGTFPKNFHSRLLMDSGYSQQTGGAVAGMRGTGMMFHNGTDYVYLDGRAFILGTELGGEGNRYRGEQPATQLANKTFNNGLKYIPGWINGAFDMNSDQDDIYNYNDNNGVYEFTESTDELVATAMTLFAYQDARYNNVAPLPVPRLGPVNTTTPPSGGGGTVPPNTTPNSTQNGCFTSVKDMPVTCTGGAFSQDSFDGCRHLTCSSGASSLSVLACDKPNSATAQYFEMYRQGSSGSAVSKICIGTTCLGNEGYVKSDSFPICTGNTTTPPPSGTNNTNTTPPGNTTPPPGNTTPPPTNTCTKLQSLPVNCTGTVTQDTYNGCRSVVCTNDGSSLSVLACEKPDNNAPQYFEIYKQSQTGQQLRVCLGQTCISDAGYVKSEPYNSCSTPPPSLITCSYNGQQYLPGQSFPISCGSCTCQNDGKLLCNVNSCSSQVSVSVAPWYPQGRDYIFVCNANGFAPTSYDWSFGDGSQLLGMTANNVYHSYKASGSYTVSCTAKDGNYFQTATLPVTTS